MEERVGLSSWPHATQGCKRVRLSWWEPVGKANLVSGSLTQPIKDRWLLPTSSQEHPHRPPSQPSLSIPPCIRRWPFSQLTWPFFGSHLLTQSDPHLALRGLCSSPWSTQFHDTPYFSLIHLTWGISSTYLKPTGLVNENQEDRSESKLWDLFVSPVTCLQCRDKCTI